MSNSVKSINHIDYIGNELELFKHAVHWKNYFSSKIRPYIKGDVLEVGAGIGVNTEYLARDRAAIQSWCLLEPDRNLAAQIEENTAALGLQNKSIINGIITDIADKKFDTIIYIDVLEHIEASVAEIQQVKARLKPGGHLIILVPAYNFLYNNFDKKIGHFRRYNKRLLLQEVDGSLRKERLFYLDSLGFFASLANKLILKKELPSLENVRFWDNWLVPPSKVFDVLYFRSFGKSLIGVFCHES
jgi:SAM-dependent methyltransferase